MAGVNLDQCQSRTAAYIFLRSLWDLNPKKFAGNGKGLGALLNFVNCGLDFDCEWRRAYVTSLAKPWAADDCLTSEQIFLIMTEVVERYERKYKFDLSEVRKLIRSMNDSPLMHQEEIRLWERAMEDSLAGKEIEWVMDHYFLDWYEKKSINQ